MKKSLIALAALAATASFAQSSVTLSGIMDANYSSISNLNGQRTNLVNQNGARTTTFKFNGSEDLGGGLSANFQFEVQPSIIAGNGNAYNAAYPAVANGVAANGAAQATGAASAQSGLVGKGQSFVGLKSSQFGEVQFGTINTATFGAYAAVSALGTGVGSGYGSGNTFGDITRVESSVAYKSPVFSGFDFSVLYGTKNDSQFGTYSTSTNTGVTLRRPEVTDIGLGYTNGPLAVKFGRLESKTSPNESTAAGSNAKTVTQVLGAAYDFGMAKVSGGVGTIKSSGPAVTAPVDNKLQMFAVTVPFAGNRFIAQYGQNKAEGTSTSYVNGAKSKTTGIALERDLSKRTFVYVRYENTDLAGFAANGYVANGARLTDWTGGSKRTVTAVGISHAF